MYDLQIIGSTALIDLPKYGIYNVPAKVDTGADNSSVWASDLKKRGNTLQFKLFGPESEFYTGEWVYAEQFTTKSIINSFGHKEVRYSVKLSITVDGRRIRAMVTLSNRANSTYPVLLGRRLLANKFLVDVRHRPIKLTHSSVMDSRKRRK